MDNIDSFGNVFGNEETKHSVHGNDLDHRFNKIYSPHLTGKFTFSSFDFGINSLEEVLKNNIFFFALRRGGSEVSLN